MRHFVQGTLVLGITLAAAASSVTAQELPSRRL